MRLAWLVLASLMLPMPWIARADPYPQWGDCGSAGEPALERIEVTGGSAGTTIYVDDENWALGNGIWTYQESNGLWVPKLPGVYFEGHSNANLQRGGSSPWVPGDNDICADAPDWGPDSVLL